jgi:hypothetical protein
MPFEFTIDPLPMTECERVRALARGIRDTAHFEEIVAQVADPAMRAEVRMMLSSLVQFEVPPESTEP